MLARRCVCETSVLCDDDVDCAKYDVTDSLVRITFLSHNGRGIKFSSAIDSTSGDWTRKHLKFEMLKI